MFSPTSPLNTPIPAGATFVGNAIPPSPSGYSPGVDSGAWSTGLFTGGTEPMMVFGPKGQKLNNEGRPPVEYLVVRHWPDDTVGATGTDGHACVIDGNTVYSFGVLRQDAGRWRAQYVASCPADGSGFGDASHAFAGTRASGASLAAGLILTEELHDLSGDFGHALACSLPLYALKPGFVLPARSQDGSWATTYKGEFPMGSRLALPPTFDGSKIKDPRIAKIARTLMRFGMFVVDANFDTPFLIYAQIGSGLQLGWPQQADWSLIQAGLHRVMGD